MPFAQLVIGPPGAGKSTYCDGMQQFMSAIGRKCSVVNLDPANDHTTYRSAIDVRTMITLDEIMSEEHMGPNGAVLYALEELEENWDWLKEKLQSLGDDYVLFDCPGQVELFTHHSSLRNLFFKIEKLGYRLVVVNLTDSYSLTLPSLYISTLLLSLRSMLQMDLPHVNVITKIDKLSQYQKLPFSLDFYTEVHELEYLMPYLAAERTGTSQQKPGDNIEQGNSTKFDALNKAVIDLVQEFGLVSYETLAVENKKSMMGLLHAIDRAGGYAFGSAEGANDSVWQVAMREGYQPMDIHDIQERWIDRKDEMDRLEREQESSAKDLHSKATEFEDLNDELMGESLSHNSRGLDSNNFKQPTASNGIKVVKKGPSPT